MTIILPGVHKPSIMLRDGRRKAEIGTLVFAIFNFTLACTASVSAIAGTIFWYMTFIYDRSRMTEWERLEEMESDSYGLTMFVTYYLFYGIVTLMVFSLFALMFGSFLLHGVCKKKTHYIKAYFVYGVVVTVMSVMADIAYLLISDGTDLIVVAVVLLICVGYSLVLAMIRATYKNYIEHARETSSIKAMFQCNENLLEAATDAPKRI